MLTVRTNLELLTHLSTFEYDGATVSSLLFEGGRLSYPGRKEVEYQLGHSEPYTLELEARVLEGLSPKMRASIRTLAHWVHADSKHLGLEFDLTLEVLWMAHEAWDRNGISLDRLVAALVGVQALIDCNPQTTDKDLLAASEILVKGLHSLGFPPNEVGLEELFDGAPPACVGLGLVEL